MNNFVKMLKGSDPENSIQQISAEQIKPNPFQPRTTFTEDKLGDLARSIEEHGIIQPLTVRKKDKYYELIAGERRLRAARRIGLEKVPVIIRDCSDREMAEIALVENLQRHDLNFFEEARGYLLLCDKFGLTQQELATRIGKSQSTIANKLRLLNLDIKLQDEIIANNLSERHARALLRLPDEEMQRHVIDKAVAAAFNVKETEKLVEELLHKQDQGQGQQIRKVYSDIRLYLNTLRKTISELKGGGIEVQVDEREKDDCFEFTIKLVKSQNSKEAE
ncbi:MAG: nucleoid occlusion protein [Halanaerobium sp.]|nr:nucleoid occlusion protein [Halanaerobium sp.]